MSSTAGAGPTRAVVVDDLRFMRALIHTLLEDVDVEAVAEAADDCEAISVVEKNRPGVVTTDIEIPGMNGPDTVEAIMEGCPTPILILSIHAEEDANVTFEAFDQGTVDFVTKPGGEVTSKMPCVKRELVEKIQPTAAVDLSAARRGSRPPEAESGLPATAESTSAASETTEPLPIESLTLIIGASTGGPNVVERVLAALPAEADLRVPVVQRMPASFTKRFAARLDGCCDYEIHEAKDGERTGPGQVRITPDGSYLLVTSDRTGRLRLKLSGDEALHDVRPATDLTMVPTAEAVDAPLAGVLLTDMGHDGVEGMIRIGRADGHTVAQDEATSAIFRVSKRVVEAGCVGTVTASGRIADEALNGLAT